MTNTTEWAREEDVDDLLPCPFCGGEAVLKEDLVYHTAKSAGKWWATCPSCDLIRDPGYRVPKAEAIAAWNTRATPQPMGEDAVERVARALCTANGLDPDELDDVEQPLWKAWAWSARAALAAMPQPTSTVEVGDALREALTNFADRLRKIRIVTGRDEHSPDYADGYEGACEMAADEIDAALTKLDTAEKGDGE